ncbi:hypothetical protein KQX54_006237 [Cotesia glomerata]|uniref:BEN domain-containing protein n=1 Tax=Cotesia glomerata TaxID=32391 RepID=A0AAV7IT32_COTGL|nr:hypothetical protein KQX54_006237 [Cotesia glomerata]
MQYLICGEDSCLYIRQLTSIAKESQKDITVGSKVLFYDPENVQPRKQNKLSGTVLKISKSENVLKKEMDKIISQREKVGDKLIKGSTNRLNDGKILQSEKGKKINDKNLTKNVQRDDSVKTMEYLQKTKPPWRFNLPSATVVSTEYSKQVEKERETHEHNAELRRRLVNELKPLLTNALSKPTTLLISSIFLDNNSYNEKSGQSYSQQNSADNGKNIGTSIYQQYPALYEGDELSDNRHASRDFVSTSTRFREPHVQDEQFSPPQIVQGAEESNIKIRCNPPRVINIYPPPAPLLPNRPLSNRTTSNNNSLPQNRQQLSNSNISSSVSRHNQFDAIYANDLTISSKDESRALYSRNLQTSHKSRPPALSSNLMAREMRYQPYDRVQRSYESLRYEDEVTDEYQLSPSFDLPLPENHRQTLKSYHDLEFRSGNNLRNLNDLEKSPTRYDPSRSPTPQSRSSSPLPEPHHRILRRQVKSSDDEESNNENDFQVPAKQIMHKSSSNTTPCDTLWTLRYPDGKLSGTIELIPERKIFVIKRGLDNLKSVATDMRSFARGLMTLIFTEEAMSECTLCNSKGKGKGKNKDGGVKNYLDERGLKVLMEYTAAFGKERGWKKVDDQTIKQSLRNKLLEYRD